MNALKVALFASAACASAVSGQEAVVLSGGGARGIAHAGVLIGLEARGHSPQIVVGTSMGAIVGALYAAGYRPDRIAELLAGEDWRAVFAPDALTIGPQRTAVRPLVSFGVGDDELIFGGVVPDAGINRRLVELLFDAGARARSDFDRLPRRYRAVAADLADGSVVPIADGDLARAARASMAVPGVFSPIVVAGRTLVDGGIADNLPIEQAQAIGATSIIASDVLNPALEPIPTSRVAIGIRAIRLLIENARPDAAQPDVLVLPRIPPEMSEAMFPTDAIPLLEAGRRAALAEIPEDSPRAPPPPPPAALYRLADTVIVVGSGQGMEPLVRAVFASAVGGEYDVQRVLRRVNALFATGMFRGVWPRVEDRADGPTLIVHAEPVPPSILAVAAAYDDRRGLRAVLALRQRLNALGSAELRASALAHRDLRSGALELMRPLSRRADVSLGGGAHYQETDVPRFLEEGDARVHRIGGWLGSDWRSPSGRRVASLQWLIEHVDAVTRDGLSTGPALRWTEAPAYAPVVGLPVQLEATVRFGDIEYARIHASGGITRELGPVSAAVVADIAATDADAPPDALFALGAVDALPWLETGERRGTRRAIVGADVAYPIFLEGAVRARLRAGAAGSSIDDFESTRAWSAGAELGGIWPTPFGALAAGFAFGSRGETRFTIEVGNTF